MGLLEKFIRWLCILTPYEYLDSDFLSLIMSYRFLSSETKYEEALRD